MLFQGIEKFETDLTTLHPILAECRVIKSSLELQLLQFANDISSEAHVEVCYDFLSIFFLLNYLFPFPNGMLREMNKVD